MHCELLDYREDKLYAELIGNMIICVFMHGVENWPLKSALAEVPNCHFCGKGFLSNKCVKETILGESQPTS